MSARVEDLRYERYEGRLRGRLAGIVALARWSALRALGARRGWRAKVIPVALTLIAFLPAFVVLGVRALFATRINADLTEVLPYRDYFGGISVVILAFAAIVTPELLCPDRRDRVLDLYHATALSPREYLAAKLLGALAPLLLVSLFPVVFLYIGNVLFAEHPLGYLERHLGDIPRIVLAGVLIALFYALLGLAVSSLTSRWAFSIGGFAVLLIGASSASAVLVGGLGASRTFELIAIPAIPIVTTHRLFPSREPFEGVGTAGWMAAYAVVAAISVLILLARYRRPEE
jgi:ABC-2 type transport system permease protein